MNTTPNPQLEKYEQECRNSGLSEDEVNEKIATMRSLLAEEKQERMLEVDELQGLINDIIKRKSLFRSVAYMAAAAAIGSLIAGPLLFLMAMSWKLLLMMIILIPGIIAGIGMATYYKSSYIHKAFCAVISLGVVFLIYFISDVSGAISEFGFIKTIEIVGSKLPHFLSLSFESTIHNDYALFGGLFMAAIAFHVCRGTIDSGDIRVQAARSGLGSVGFTWPNAAVHVTGLFIAFQSGSASSM